MLFLIMMIPVMLLGFWAQNRVHSTYKRFSQVGSRSRISGREAAAAVLRSAGIDDVEITSTQGHLTDHYDPMRKRLVLSEENYHGTSLAALGVAAHEAGHAIQHKVGYAALQARMALVGVTGFASSLLNILMLIAFAGFFLNFGMMSITMLKIVVACMLVITLFQAITLPVEFDASARAKAQLTELGIIGQDELPGVTKTLDAAGWTYVAAFVASLTQLLYYVIQLIGLQSDD